MAQASKPAKPKSTTAKARPARTPARASTAPRTLLSVNPASGEKLGEIPATAPGEVADIVTQARKAFEDWSSIDPRGRARMLREVRFSINEHLDEIVDAVANECGKPRAEALVHDVLPPIMGLAWAERAAPRYLKSGHANRFMGALAGISSRIDYKPFGVVGSITPWNYPFSLSMQAMVLPLLAGNTVVIKPSEATPAVGEVIKKVFEPLPAGVVTVIQGAGEVGAALIDAPVDKVCFIGSPATGRRIAEAAAKHLTPVVMELGGKDPAIVCADADLDKAAAGVLWGSFLNAGQTCAAIERIYVNESVAGDFERLLVEKLGRLRQGQDGEIGSLTIERQLEIVKHHVEDAVERGARVVVGGPSAGRSNKDGTLWYAPTIIEDVNGEMAVMREETFGPVVVLMKTQDDEESVRRANEEGFNLTASVWTKDRKKGERLASQIKAGTVIVNETGAVGNGTPWTPWGGVGESGYGRINGVAGLREFTQPIHVGRKSMPGMKSIWWYPYDDATNSALRSTAELLSTRSLGKKIRLVPKVLRGMTKAIKNKL